ncbi:MAG: hypothetical protein LBC55_06465 [Desulfovibrio sp.]|jgi:hypothetical protein|nr:hypothetical protein [Desulfovibrio sp.]
MRLSMPEAAIRHSGKTRRLRLALLLLAALCVAVAAGAALRRFSGRGPTIDAARPSLSGTETPAAAPAAGAVEGGNAVIPPPVVVRGTGTPVADRPPVPGAEAAEQGAADAGERERIFRLAEEEAERRLQEATSLEAAAAIAYRRAVAGAARSKAGAAEPAEAEAALERARAVVRAARRDFEAASLKRAEAGAEARRAAGPAGAGFPGRPMPRQAAAGQEVEGTPP